MISIAQHKKKLSIRSIPSSIETDNSEKNNNFQNENENLHNCEKFAKKRFIQF